MGGVCDTCVVCISVYRTVRVVVCYSVRVCHYPCGLCLCSSYVPFYSVYPLSRIYIVVVHVMSCLHFTSCLFNTPWHAFHLPALLQAHIVSGTWQKV